MFDHNKERQVTVKCGNKRLKRHHFVDAYERCTLTHSSNLHTEPQVLGHNSKDC